MSKVQVIRQGDVPLVILDRKPVFIKEVHTKRRVVRKGEHGGVHKLVDSNAVLVENRGNLADQLFETYVHVTEDTELVHTTGHHSLPLKPGWYEVREAREFFEDRSFRTYD